MFDFILGFVQDYGTPIDENIWSFKGLNVELCDEGRTIGIIWGPRLNVYKIEDEEPTFAEGKPTDLRVLYTGLKSLKQELEHVADD